MNNSSDQPRRLLQSLNMSLDIIDEVAKADRPLGITEIANLLGLSKGAVHTVLTNLEARGYVRRAPGSLAFALGRKVWELGLQAGRLFDLADLVHDDLTQLAELTGETSQIVSYVSPGEILFLHRVLSRHPVQASVPIGDRAPASTTSSGQVLLAYQPQAEIDKVLGRPLPAVTPFSITDPARFTALLQTVRAEGFAINVNTHYLDTVTMSVPVRDHMGAVAYAVSIYGPEYRFSADKARELVPDAARIAAVISEKLGYRPASAEERKVSGRR